MYAIWIIKLSNDPMNDEQIQTIFDPSLDSSLNKHKIALERLKNELSEFGLTSNQIDVYVFLGKYGSKTAPEISKTLGIPRTETYHLLTSLQNKGLVSATFQHPIRFSAMPISKAVWILVNAEKERVNALEEHEKDIVSLWENIPQFNAIEQIKENKFQIVQGSNQINSKIKDMINNTNKECLILGSENDFLKFYHSDFFTSLDKLDIDLKLLSSTSDKTSYIFDDIDRTKVRKMSDNIQENLCFIVKDDNELIFFIKNINQKPQEMSAIWTDSESMIYSMKTLFQSIWIKSKNIHL